MDDLFSASTRERSFKNAPLAVRMRPNSLDEYVGQQKAVGKGSWLRAAIEHDVLSSVILYGPAGTGKTTLAHIIANHTKSEFVEVSAVTGTVKDLRRVIDEAKTRLNTYDRRTILFIDEIHTIIGAGSAPGSMDAANMLKPALARGEIQCIGATTTDEFRKSIEKDGALERRFQKVMVEPTTPEETVQILDNIKERYEDHHNVRYTPEAIRACVQLTERYVSDRCFPDKAIDALDEAGSRIHITHSPVSKEMEEQCFSKSQFNLPIQVPHRYTFTIIGSFFIPSYVYC